MFTGGNILDNVDLVAIRTTATALGMGAGCNSRAGGNCIPIAIYAQEGAFVARHGASDRELLRVLQW